MFYFHFHLSPYILLNNAGSPNTSVEVILVYAYFNYLLNYFRSQHVHCLHVHVYNSCMLFVLGFTPSYNFYYYILMYLHITTIVQTITT